MRFDVLTLFPEMIQEACSHSIMKRAVESDIISINTVNPRDYINIRKLMIHLMVVVLAWF